MADAQTAIFRELVHYDLSALWQKKKFKSKPDRTGCESQVEIKTVKVNNLTGSLVSIGSKPNLRNRSSQGRRRGFQKLPKAEAVGWFGYNLQSAKDHGSVLTSLPMLRNRARTKYPVVWHRSSPTRGPQKGTCQLARNRKKPGQAPGPHRPVRPTVESARPIAARKSINQLQEQGADACLKVARAVGAEVHLRSVELRPRVYAARVLGRVVDRGHCGVPAHGRKATLGGGARDAFDAGSVEEEGVRSFVAEAIVASTRSSSSERTEWTRKREERNLIVACSDRGLIRA
ncbi:hypothetical protein C8R44DRAFT_739989 [Mycena epipterygia]|nr:hypothetical protein C8R44DRAFT_739989 [Mycena epipterygia]